MVTLRLAGRRHNSACKANDIGIPAGLKRMKGRNSMQARPPPPPAAAHRPPPAMRARLHDIRAPSAEYSGMDRHSSAALQKMVLSGNHMSAAWRHGHQLMAKSRMAVPRCKSSLPLRVLATTAPYRHGATMKRARGLRLKDEVAQGEAQPDLEGHARGTHARSAVWAAAASLLSQHPGLSGRCASSPLGALHMLQE